MNGLNKINTTDRRMLKAVALVKESKGIYKKNIYEQINFIPQNEYHIKQGTQHFTADNIRLFCEKYNVDVRYVFGFSDNVFTVNKNVNRAANKKETATAH